MCYSHDEVTADTQRVHTCVPASGETPKEATRDPTIAAESCELLNELGKVEFTSRMIGGRGFGKVIMVEASKAIRFSVLTTAKLIGNKGRLVHFSNLIKNLLYRLRQYILWYI